MCHLKASQLEVSIEHIPCMSVYGIECYTGNYSSSADSATPRDWLHHINAPCIEHGAIENRVWMYWQWRWVCILITSHLMLYNMAARSKAVKFIAMRYLGKIRGKPGLLSCSTIVRASHWNATLLPITLSLGLCCLLGTYRIQIWSKLRNRLRTITMLVHRRPKVVIMCPHVVQAQITTTVCTLNIWAWIHKSNKCLIIPSGNCTPGRPERLRLVFSRHSLGFLLSLLCLAAFAWASCCFLFIITSGTSESRFHNLPQ